MKYNKTQEIEHGIQVYSPEFKVLTIEHKDTPLLHMVAALQRTVSKLSKPVTSKALVRQSRRL